MLIRWVHDFTIEIYENGFYSQVEQGVEAADAFFLFTIEDDLEKERNKNTEVGVQVALGQCWKT